MQSQHENELQAMQVTLKKVEKELGYKDEEARHYRKMASDVAEKYEKCDREIRHLKDTINDRDKDNDRLEARIVEFEVRIGKINTEKFELCQEFEKKDNEKNALGKKIEDLNITISHMEGDISRQQVECDDRELAMKQMQETLVKRGEQNRRLSETVNTIKN